MKKSKCSFFSKEIQYLDHILGATGIQPLTSKTHAIQHMNPPTTPKPSRILQKIYQRIHKNSKSTHSTHQTTSKIQLDTTTSRSLYTFERSHCPGTHTPLPLTQIKLTSYTQMLLMMLVEHSSLKNTIEPGFQ